MKKILHMDDEEDTLSLVKTVLEKEGYKMTSVSRGKEALGKVVAENYDLLLLDVMMPDLSGWDVFFEVMKKHPKQKIVFLTVIEVSAEKRKELEKYGVVDYITKPFDKDDLVKRIKAALGE